MFNLNFQAMQNFIIRTHKPETLYMGHHFFILCKGMNSGKPLHQPCPNSFVLIFDNEVAKDSYYWLSYSLWKCRFWHQHLVGSVIPFIRIVDFKKQFFATTSQMLNEHDEHLKNVAALKLLEQKELHVNKNLNLIAEMRKAIIHRYISKY